MGELPSSAIRCTLHSGPLHGPGGLGAASCSIHWKWVPSKTAGSAIR
ncbi:MAG: hypothetical protein ACRENE_03110 [Polyangiaceae bacterium]